MSNLFVVLTVLSCALDLVAIYAWRKRAELLEASVGDLTVVFLLGWLWAGWGARLAVQEDTSRIFALCSLAVVACGLSTFIAGTRKDWISYALFGAWKMLHGLVALFVAGF